MLTIVRCVHFSGAPASLRIVVEVTTRGTPTCSTVESIWEYTRLVLPVPTASHTPCSIARDLRRRSTHLWYHTSFLLSISAWYLSVEVDVISFSLTVIPCSHGTTSQFTNARPDDCWYAYGNRLALWRLHTHVQAFLFCSSVYSLDFFPLDVAG